MSNSYNYNPIPPRVWSRVQNPCTYSIPGNDYTNVFIPLTGEVLSQAKANNEIKMFYKGNILQYKGNSARLTKSQKYSQLARCVGPNRTKVFATQSETYTNPNTTGLLRVNYTTYPYPNEIVGAPNSVTNPNDCSGNLLQDGGTLVCGTYANPCSGEIYKQGITTSTICNESAASNVPGLEILCWNKKIPTWFSKSRYFMNNSTDKWPVNYKGLVSAVNLPPPILNASFNCTTIFLSWTQPFSCFKITSYDIYINNLLYIGVSSNTFNYNFNLSNGIYDIYIIAKSNFIFSKPSNSILLTIDDSIVINSFSNIKNTIYKSDGFTTIVIETTLQPSFNGGGVGMANLNICNNVSALNFLIVGGGGGGASGYYSGGTADSSGGGGGGSGSINLINNFIISSFTNVNINVGSGGGGRTPGNKGAGNSSGQSGYNSSIEFNDSIQFKSSSGGGGLGIGTNSVGGGIGGNATQVNGSGTYSGYGGSGGGGAWKTTNGALNKYGYGGTGYTNNGNNGYNGNFGNTQTGGNGGNSIYTGITIPNLGIINIGGGGGGGGKYGGYAGNNGLGGNGGSSSSEVFNGQNSTTYGAGGGGGGGGSYRNNFGGNGGNGVIIIWYKE